MEHERKRVLLFEDDWESMGVLQEYLEEEMGWDVDLSAEKALLDRLRRERFDLLVVDAMIHPWSLDADGEEVENVAFEGINWQRQGPSSCGVCGRANSETRPGPARPPTCRSLSCRPWPAIRSRASWGRM